MSPTLNQSATHSSSRLWLAGSLCVLALGLLGWRSVTLFSTPPTPVNPHPLAEMVTTIVGPGNARISETATGGVLIVLNGPEGPIDPDLTARLTDIAQTVSTDGLAPVLRQFPFARQAGFNPTNENLAELAVLGLFAMLTVFLSLSLRRYDANAPEQTPRPFSHVTPDMALASMLKETAPPPPFDTAPGLTAIEGKAAQMSPGTLADAQRFAEANPDVTAKVIERWIRARGFTE